MPRKACPAGRPATAWRRACWDALSPRAEVATSTSARTRPGAIRATSRATKPPMEKPTSTKRSGASASTRAAMPASVSSWNRSP